MGKRNKRVGLSRFPEGTGLLEDQRGAVLLMTVLLLVFLLLLAGIGADLARVWVAREDLQTAVDSAALAGSLHGVRYVTITVGYGHDATCCGENDCWPCCECDPPVTLTGAEKDLVEKGGWRRGTCCDRFLGTEERWMQYPGGTESVARTMLDANWPELMTPAGGGKMVGSPDIQTHESGRYAPSVVARARGSINTVLLKIVGIDTIEFERCGQAGTFYDVITGGWALGKNGAPGDACKK